MSKGFPIPLSVDELLARARGVSRIDRVDHEVVEPLTMLHRSFNEESCLHERGAIAQQAKLLRLLCNRLRMQRDLAAHPEILEQRIVRPLIISGMGRSGTTKTQKILAASGDFNWLPYWQTFNSSLFTGSRDESPQARIDEADAHCTWFDAMSPETRFGHPFETFEPEEDSLLLEQSFRSPSFLGYSSVPGFLGWLAGQDAARMFEFLRDVLKYLQWQGLASAARPWLLKAPIYYGIEADLLKVFPDACIVMTHRPPAETVASSCKLIDCFHRPYTEVPFAGPELNQALAMQMDLHLDLRRRLANFRLLDVYYRHLNSSVEPVLEQIYHFYGMPLADDSRRRMLDWDKTNPRHKKGEFKYSLEQFQLSEAQVNTAFSRYLEFLRRFNDT